MTARQQENGFTLVELLVAIAIVGILIPAVAGAFVIWLQTDQAAVDRLDASNNADLATLYFSGDAQSATRLDSAQACGAGGSLITFVREETSYDAAGTETVQKRVTTYRLNGSGDQLVRTACLDAGTPAEQVVARRLDPSTLPQLTCSVNGTDFTPCANGPSPGVVRLTLRAQEGYTYTLLNRKRAA